MSDGDAAPSSDTNSDLPWQRPDLPDPGVDRDDLVEFDDYTLDAYVEGLNDFLPHDMKLTTTNTREDKIRSITLCEGWLDRQVRLLQQQNHEEDLQVQPACSDDDLSSESRVSSEKTPVPGLGKNWFSRIGSRCLLYCFVRGDYYRHVQSTFPTEEDAKLQLRLSEEAKRCRQEGEEPETEVEPPLDCEERSDGV